MLLAGGCKAGSDTAQGVAERFLDQHYVRMNLPGAVEYCTGLAKHKVEEEIRLVGEQEVDASTRQPGVSYTLAEEVPEGEGRVSFVYDGTIRLGGGDRFTMRWLVNTRREGDEWKVSNFKEMPGKPES